MACMLAKHLGREETHAVRAAPIILFKEAFYLTGPAANCNVARFPRLPRYPPDPKVFYEYHRCRNHRALPAGRRRRIRLRLSRRGGAFHLRRALQAEQGKARARASRAG